MGYSSWDHKESDTTKRLTVSLSLVVTYMCCFFLKISTMDMYIYLFILILLLVSFPFFEYTKGRLELQMGCV